MGKQEKTPDNFNGFSTFADGIWKEPKDPLPMRVAKGVVSVGASVLICAGFGLMALCIPKNTPPSGRK